MLINLKKILFTSMFLFLIGCGSKPTNISYFYLQNILNLTWSSDGEKIAFIYEYGKKLPKDKEEAIFSLYIIDKNGKNLKFISDYNKFPIQNGVVNFEPFKICWSNNNQEITFIENPNEKYTNQEKNTNIFSIDLNGKKGKVLQLENLTSSTLSPDRKYLVLTFCIDLISPPL